ncbi:hypothetical protein [Paenibacillus macerans]|uniref:hypothetical protein n=1 Tax=Paenibacillus macerans TaxID=44252 RepID=UPI003D318EBD
MKRTKVTVAVIAATLLSLFSVASAAPASSYVPNQKTTTPATQVAEQSNVVVKGYDEALFYPLDALLINNVTHTGNTAYTGEFSTDPGNGKNLNVWVKNNSNVTVYLTIKRNGTEFVSDIAIAAGGQRTQTFVEQVASGLSGDWEVYVYNKTGDQYNLNVSARQF